MSEKLNVMISSTVIDLPEYRNKAKDACLRASMFPKMMDHLSALNADSVEVSLSLVDDSDIYVGLFAYRYGYIPEGYDKSITEMEYERAVERGIPRLIFLIDDDVPVLRRDVDTGDSANKIEALKRRLLKERVVAFFKSPEDLSGLIFQSLSEVKGVLEQEKGEIDDSPRAVASRLHRISSIPGKPEPYIAHPYTLLQLKGLIGRKPELDLLTDWITKPELNDIRVFNIVAIGGMGKSALTWEWFNEIAPQEVDWAGRIWWSFYESDASFENFITRALAYVTRTSPEEYKNVSVMEQQDMLLMKLEREQYLLVLDGLERILIAYARQDAAYLFNEDTIDEETANRVAGAHGLPESAGQSFIGKHKLRMTADIRAGRFLQRLARIRNSRVLISTRLFPADLQMGNGGPVYGCGVRFLEGLSDGDALELWRAYGAKGSREKMLPLLNTFDKHPLLIKILANEVSGFRDTPGDFDAWQAANPDFNPFEMPILNVQSEILEFALRGLSDKERRALHVIAGFRMPANMNTVKALLVKSGEDDDEVEKPFSTLSGLDHVLTTLEDRGLMGWDRVANRYDLHPIVRGVVWNGLDDSERSDIYRSLRSHFESIPMIANWEEVESVEDLTPAVELYNTLVELEKYEEAVALFRNRLEKATLYRLSASHLRVELLEQLFPDGLDKLPRISKIKKQSYSLNALALAYKRCGRAGSAITLFNRANEIDLREDDLKNLSIGLRNMSSALRKTGSIYWAEAASNKALLIDRDLLNDSGEGIALYTIAVVFSSRGNYLESETVLCRSLRIWKNMNDVQGKVLVNAYLSENKLLQGDTESAQEFADRAWKFAVINRYEMDFIRAARLQGSSALAFNNLKTADERLHYALERARKVHLVEEELPILISLAELHRKQNDSEKARELLEDVWEPAERGPYPLFEADARNVLARIELDAGNKDAAIEAATEAYRKAWCDGPPYAYHFGLENAKKLLSELDAPEPDMPPFDQSKFEPMPEVELNPPDQYGSDDVELSE